ncbi:Mini-ribonuclease 3 [Paenibacillus gorillae]|uniref:Mini-ribonuclease 3 n=1 Tax=Paenibacillus gorillae TaxID=1243662 RepID=UPI0004B3B67A|nr:ribonuclease III domain-containing protein [Paenibacillus gorillae]
MLNDDNSGAGQTADELERGRSSLLFHSPSKKPQLINPVVLAYVGDGVFELMVRQYLVSLPNHKPHHLHREATSMVSAKAQRKLLERWQPLLTEEEADIVRRGRNAKSGAPPKNADPADYRQATALECLVGYLYYEGRTARLQELFEVAIAPVDAAKALD